MLENNFVVSLLVLLLFLLQISAQMHQLRSIPILCDGFTWFQQLIMHHPDLVPSNAEHNLSVVREPTANIWVDKITGQILLGNVVYMLKNNNPRAANVIPPALYALTNC